MVSLLEKICKGWNFTGMDSRGHSGGLAIGWCSRTIKVINDWGFDSGLRIKVFVEDLVSCITIINVYGPSQDRVPFWDNLFNKYFLENEDLILGGDLNFSLGEAESWGPIAHPDNQAGFFSHLMASNGLIDVAPLKMLPTWKNMRTGEARVTKILDRFLIFEPIAMLPLQFRQRIGSRGELDH